MKNCQTLTFNDLSENLHVVADHQDDFIHLAANHKTWGKLHNRTFYHKFFGIQEYQADLHAAFRLTFNEEQMVNNMNICMVLDGGMQLDLKESRFVTGLSRREHHGVYANETAYDLIIDKAVRVVHITVDREYYAGLLQEREASESQMKRKLLEKEKVWNGKATMSQAMTRAVQDMLFNPLRGHLKSLFVEGKILEILALHLNDVKSGQPAISLFRDKEVFFELRKYLDENFREELSLRSLSRMFGVNEFKLKKGFKTLFNTTVFDYIHELKMMHARTLLCDEKKLVNEVAGAIGYKNANHFSTAFKRKFGVSPTAMK